MTQERLPNLKLLATTVSHLLLAPEALTEKSKLGLLKVLTSLQSGSAE